MKDEDFQFIFEEEFIKEVEEEQNPQNDYGYKEVLKERQKKKDALRLRLKGYYLDEKEINYLLSIVEKCEKKIEKIKNSYDFSKPKDGMAEQMLDRLLKAQDDMKKEFDRELLKIMKKKYENAKKILEERKNTKAN